MLLQNQLNTVVEQLRNSVANKDLDASGDLRKSFVTTKPNFKNGTLEIGVEANYYYKFLDQGVNGSKVNHGAPNWGAQPKGDKTFTQHIEEWIKFRGIKPKGEIYKWSYDSLNFMIRKTIIENGKEPANFVAEAVNDKLIDNMSQEISNLVGRAIEVKITLEHG